MRSRLYKPVLLLLAALLVVSSATCQRLMNRQRASLSLAQPSGAAFLRWLWLPILHGIILRVRPRASAKKYAAIWTPAGSPLAIESEALRRGLEQSLAAHAAFWQQVVARAGRPELAQAPGT